MKNYLATLLLLFCAFPVFSQLIVKGNLTDSKSEPIIGATLLLYRSADSTLAKTGLSDVDGSFELPVATSGKYHLHISYIGYETLITPSFEVGSTGTPTLGNLILKEATTNLSEVVVTTTRPLVEIKPDKTVFNVEGTMNAVGNTALDLLRKAPGVVLDQNNNISVKGKSGVMVYIDGKQSPFAGDDLVNYLRSLNSSQIQNIEIITNPSSKYDAAGNAGIINIRLKKAQNMGGNGSVSADYNQGFYAKYNANVSGNYRTAHFNVFGNYGYNDSRWRNINNFLREQSGNTFDQEAIQVSKNQGHNFKAGADYFLNERHTLGVMVRGNIGKSKWTSNSNSDIGAIGGGIERVLSSQSINPDTSTNLSYNFNYKYEDTSGVSLNFDADYGVYRADGSSYQPNIYRDYQTKEMLFENNFGNTTMSDIDILTFKLDYERNVFGGKLGVGAKFAQVGTINDFKFFDIVGGKYLINQDRTNKFDYDEKISAAYVNYNRSINKKWSFQAGLRLEHTRAIGTLSSLKPGEENKPAVDREYTNLFPSGGITYTMNDKNTFGLTFSRRIDRPNYQSLNPFEYKLDELTFQKGNPLLRPQFSNIVELSHSFMGFLNTSINYTRTKDVFSEIVLQSNDSTAMMQTLNVADQDNIGFNINAPLPIKKWWNGFVNVGVNWQRNQADFGNGNKFDISATSWNAYMQHAFTLGKGYSLELSGWYSSPGIWGGTFKSIGLGAADIGLQKKILHDKGSVRLTFTDIFHTAKWGGESNINGFRMIATGQWESQQIKLNVSYSFGNNKVQSRRRSTGIEDEAGRIKKSN